MSMPGRDSIAWNDSWTRRIPIEVDGQQKKARVLNAPEPLAITKFSSFHCMVCSWGISQAFPIRNRSGREA